MSRFPPLLQKLHESPSAADSRRSGVFRGDVRSANWDGGGDLASGKDTDASAGYLLDYSSGSIQVQSIFAEGGSIGDLTISGELTIENWLTLSTSGGLRTAASGQRIEIRNSTANVLYFFSGDADELAPGTITEQISGSGTTRTAQFGTYTPRLEQTSASQVDARGAFVVRSGSPDGTTTNPGFVFAQLFAASGGGQALEININNAIPLVTTGVLGFTALGTAAAPAIGLGTNFDDGLFSPVDSEIGVAIAGTMAMRITAGFTGSGANATGAYRLKNDAAGSAGAPDYSFLNHPTTGLYESAANELGFSTSATRRLAINSTRVSAGNVSFLGMPVKATTGDPTSPQNGDMYVNTFDNKVRVYADAAWRDLATW